MSEIVYNLGDSAVFGAFHDLHVPIPIPIQLPQRNSASAAHVCAADALFLCGTELLVAYLVQSWTKLAHE